MLIELKYSEQIKINDIEINVSAKEYRFVSRGTLEDLESLSEKGELMAILGVNGSENIEVNLTLERIEDLKILKIMNRYGVEKFSSGIIKIKNEESIRPYDYYD